MPESKHTVSKGSSYLSHSAYRKIKRVLSFRRRVFGQRLEETVVYERRYGHHVVPLVVEQCVGFIRQRGLKEVGLFRLPGQATLVKELQEAFDTGEKPSFDSSTDVHTVASLLKLYLRELPEPVVPFSRYQDFLLCGRMLSADRKQGLVQLKAHVHELPVANFNLLHYICEFLHEVQSHSDSNKMSTQNLATVFGPNILRPKAEDPESIIGGAAVVQQLMSELIGEHQNLFLTRGEADSRAASGPDAVPPGRLRGAMCGEALESAAQSSTSSQDASRKGLHVHHHASRPPVSPLADEGAKGLPQSSPNNVTAQCVPPTDHGAPETPLLGNFSIPRNSEKFPPRVDSCSAKTEAIPPAGAPRPAPAAVPTEIPMQDGSGPSGALANRWRGPGRRSWAKDSQNSGLCDGRKSAVPLDCTLSIYENVDRSGSACCDGSGGALCIRAPEDGMTSVESSSWSSCEIFLEESAAGSRATLSRSPSLRVDPGEPRINSDASSSIAEAPLSSGSSEVFLPSVPPDQSSQLSSTMDRLLASLQQQMAKQRAEYEAQIKSLERRNEALQEEVAALRANLEQQRRWYSVAEVKMRNAERARLDADRRNAALQREMEQFFDTFGELNVEVRKTERIAQSF
ncbi:rho GTPase-activating protein 24-like [Scleropages formosus]|uniref:Si:ch211-247j9.1 n=1 Tax=Scleropages formosus TaxID=113540 RepID=A0A8C9SIT5_SCLFO|nr:rho GTPase-activating protein 24-like [Scleropages formosus]